MPRHARACEGLARQWFAPKLVLNRTRACDLVPVNNLLAVDHRVLGGCTATLHLTSRFAPVLPMKLHSDLWPTSLSALQALDLLIQFSGLDLHRRNFSLQCLNMVRNSIVKKADVHLCALVQHVAC